MKRNTVRYPVRIPKPPVTSNYTYSSSTIVNSVNEFLDMSAYQGMVANIEKFHKQERNTQEKNSTGAISIKEALIHCTDINGKNIIPPTSGCEECEKEGTEWVAHRLCLTCGSRSML